MQIGVVIGKVIATMKAGQKEGIPLLIVQQLDEKLKKKEKIYVCTDSLNVKHDDVVLTCGSSSARMTNQTRSVCTDNTIVAVVDSISSSQKQIYRKM